MLLFCYIYMNELVITNYSCNWLSWKKIDNFHDLLIINIKMLCYSCLMITVNTYDKQTLCFLIVDQYDNCYVSIKEIAHY